VGTVVNFPATPPAFGQASQSNCELEQIHLPGSIQPHGALLVVREDDLTIVRASQNAAGMIASDSSLQLLGSSIDSVDAALRRQIRAAIADSDIDVPVALPGGPDSRLDCVIHRAPSGELVLEFEQISHIGLNVPEVLQAGINSVTEAASLQSLCDVATKLFKTLFGYDRVMIYRFAQEGHGEVFSEQCEPDMEPYLGNRYPASDIPQIARDLYKKNRVRMLADVDYTASILTPPPSSENNDRFDMSLCHLRSMSPIHLQYLRNMGVEATLVSSLLIGDTLWGLITCNHAKPRRIGYEMRLIAELLGEIVATRISALESLAQTRNELAVQELEKNMVEAITREGEWTSALFDRSDKLLQTLDATGAALITQDGFWSQGDVPAQDELKRLADWLDNHQAEGCFSTASIGLDYPEFDSIGDTTPGVMSCPVSRLGGEYIFWFRPEHVRTIAWGGNPNKVLGSEGDPEELSPRRSFEKWTQLLEHTADDWTLAERSAANLIGASIGDVMQQLRAMRVMIAHNQLESLSHQITHSDLPALIADADGGILLRNNAFDNLMWTDRSGIAHLADLPRLFEEHASASYNLSELFTHQRSWRGSATLDSKPVLIRADAVFSTPETVLGYVVLLTDISDRQLAENARRRFPQRNLKDFQHTPPNIVGTAKQTYESLLAAVLENAQLAVMEITDGIDAKRVPVMLRNVEASVSRTSRLIGNLIQRADSVSE